jgi:hypothetical protein
MEEKILCGTQCNKDCIIQPDAAATLVEAGTCPNKLYKKTDLLRQIGFLFIVAF